MKVTTTIDGHTYTIDGTVAEVRELLGSESVNGSQKKIKYPRRGTQVKCPICERGFLQYKGSPKTCSRGYCRSKQKENSMKKRWEIKKIENGN